MKGSLAFSANSRTVRARCFLNSSSNMIDPTLQAERLDGNSNALGGKQLKNGLDGWAAATVFHSFTLGGEYNATPFASASLKIDFRPG
jgi:hypothetical protein